MVFPVYSAILTKKDIALTSAVLLIGTGLQTLIANFAGHLIAISGGTQRLFFAVRSAAIPFKEKPKPLPSVTESGVTLKGVTLSNAVRNVDTMNTQRFLAFTI